MHHEIFQREIRGDHHYVAARFWESTRQHRAGRPAVLINDFRLHLPRAFTAARDEVIDDELRAYAARAFARGWHGDRRGTTSVYQVSASGDDGWLSPAPAFDDTDNQVLVGNFGGTALDAWYRFAGVSGLSGVTINSAILSLWGWDVDTGTPQTLLTFDQQTAPANPTDHTDYTARTVGSTVAWNSPTLSTGGWTDSPELAALVQQIVDDVGSPSELLLMHMDAGSATNDMVHAYSYDGLDTRAAKLTIDSSAAGLLTPPRLTRRFSRPIYRR